MKKQPDDEEIKVNRRKSDKLFFESPLIQSISDSIDFLRDESKSILNELDSTEFKQQIDEFDLEEFGEETINQITGIVDDLAQFKDEIIDPDEIPDVVKDSSNDVKFALNRDGDYVRRAKRRLDTEDYDNDTRIIQLCDKAISVNYLNWEAYYIKGIALINLKKYEEAIEQLIKSLALNEDNLDARLSIANAYRLNGDYKKAIGVYDSVLARDVDSFEAYKGKALTYYDWNNYDEAKLFFKKANSIQILDDESKEIWDACSN